MDLTLIDYVDQSGHGTVNNDIKYEVIKHDYMLS